MRARNREIVRPAARAVAVVAGVYCGALVVLLAANVLQLRQVDLLESPALDRLVERLSASPGDKELREFGWVIGGFFAILSGFSWWRGHHPVIFPVLAALTLVLAWRAPSLLRPAQKAWMVLALMIGGGMTRLILSILFFLIISPIALLSRVCGKRFMEEGHQPSSDSYWRVRPASKKDPAKYEVQY